MINESDKTSFAEKSILLKRDFTTFAFTSHELRSPLNTTLNYLKFIKEGFYNDPAELQEYVNAAYQSVESLVTVINDVLDIANIEAGLMQVELEEVDLLSLLEEQRRLFCFESHRKKIPLVIQCESAHVLADTVKLKRVLTNLLSNAFKFTNSGEICVRSTQRIVRQRRMVEISVTDTGIGIDISKQNLLFEPFVQADPSISRQYGGTGLGLSLCKQLVELMGGQIWLSSLGLGQGTQVTFTLPYPTNTNTSGSSDR